jgi:Zn-dependent metalloprotease
MLKHFVQAAALVFAVLLAQASPSHAAIKVFAATEPGYSLPDSLTLSTSAYRNGVINKGTAAQELIATLNRIAPDLGLAGPFNGENLVFKRAKKSPQGISLHFSQRHNRVAIEGAELIALFNNQGTLEVLNSSLLVSGGFNVQPEISREAALLAAARTLGYTTPDLGAGSRDGLLIAPIAGSTDGYALVWQLSFREADTGDRPVEVQIFARGTRRGQINRSRSLAHAIAPTSPITIFDSSVTAIIPNPIYKGVKVLENGKPTLIGRVVPMDEANAAHSSFTKVLDFYARKFERNGYDDAGAPVMASVNVQKFGFLDVLGQRQNAAWMAPWKMFIFGAGGEELGNFPGSIDVVGHEYTHAVVSATSDLIYEGESGALNEHLADVFGAMIEVDAGGKGNPYLIGDTVLRGDLKKEAEALRDMLHPEKGLSPQPGKVSETPAEFAPGCTPTNGNDNCGVHILSGIPNRAIALMVEKLGWESLHPLAYRVMTQRLRSSSDFRDYRAQWEDECESSLSKNACKVVKSAFVAAEMGI